MLRLTTRIFRWVFSTELPSDVAIDHTLYDPHESSTFQNGTDESFIVNYNGGYAVVGYAGTEQVNIGGAVVQHQTIGVATNVSTLRLSTDGVLGLGFADRVYNSSELFHFVPNFMESLQDQLPEPVFTVNLQRPPLTSALEFGYVNQSLYQGNLTTVQVDSSLGRWMVPNVTYTSNDQALDNGQHDLVFGS